MGHAQRILPSAAEYLAAEELSPIRHEYVNGEIFAMTGGSFRHNRIALNAATALLACLRGSPCQVFINDVRLHIARDNAYYYPDLIVACGESFRTAGEDKSVTDPLLVVEVLSPSTENIDRREKLAAYRRVSALAEYILISQNRQQVEIYRRQGDIGWLYLSFEADETVEFASVGLNLPIQELYQGTDVGEV